MTAAVRHERVTIWRRLGADELMHLVGTTAGRLLVGAVAGLAVLTLIGLVALWPRDHARAGNQRTVPGRVVRVIDARCGDGAAQRCRSVVMRVADHEIAMPLGVVGVVPNVKAGDKVRLINLSGRGATDDAHLYELAGFDRRAPLLWIALLVAIAAVALLRVRGMLAVLGVALSLALLLWFLMPALLAGRPALLVAVVASLAVMFITLVLTNGIGVQTLAASLGIASTLGLTCLLSTIAVRVAHLDGSLEGSLLSLRGQSGGLSVLGITLSAMLIGALGVLADTAVTQSSAVMALRRTDPALGARQLYGRAFTVGRDHLSATIHTLVLAYAGTALPLLLLLRNGGYHAVDALTADELAVPIVATLVGCAALLAAVPLTTALASVFAARLPAGMVSGGHHHHH